MTDPSTQLEKYQKVLRYYQQNLEILKARLQQQNQEVAQRQQKINQLHSRLESTQQSLTHAKPSPLDLQLVSHLMTNLESSIEQANRELNESNRELDSRRADLREQMSKIDSLEKIVTKTAAAIEHGRRRTEQIQLDERYLNTYFTG